MPLGLMREAEYQDLSFDLEEKFVIFYSDAGSEFENL